MNDYSKVENIVASAEKRQKPSVLKMKAYKTIIKVSTADTYEQGQIIKYCGRTFKVNFVDDIQWFTNLHIEEIKIDELKEITLLR